MVQLNQLEELFKALADATRLRILRLLMAGSCASVIFTMR